MAGFHAKGSDVVVEIPDCQLLHPDLMAALPVAQALAIAGASRKNGISVAATVTETAGWTLRSRRVNRLTGRSGLNWPTLPKRMTWRGWPGAMR